MLHLAQVQKADPEGRVVLKLLAHQKSQYNWALLADDECIEAEVSNCSEGVLVLIEISNTRQVKSIEAATTWVLELVEQYLGTSLTPLMLQEEVERAEQWRQSLTLQSQEMGRRAIETEARREKLLEMEEGLKLERKQLEEREEGLRVGIRQLEAQRHYLDELEENLRREKKQLDSLTVEFEAQRHYLDELEENLRREKKQLDSLAAELKANVNQ